MRQPIQTETYPSIHHLLQYGPSAERCGVPAIRNHTAKHTYWICRTAACRNINYRVRMSLFRELRMLGNDMRRSRRAGISNTYSINQPLDRWLSVKV